MSATDTTTPSKKTRCEMWDEILRIKYDLETRGFVEMALYLDVDDKCNDTEMEIMYFRAKYQWDVAKRQQEREHLVETFYDKVIEPFVDPTRSRNYVKDKAQIIDASVTLLKLLLDQQGKS